MAQFDFSDKVAIVTGGASGIGEAVVHQLAEGGAKVVIADFDEISGQAVAEKVNADGGTASFFKIDVSNPEDVEAMVRFAVDTYGGLHVAVNNAGIGGAQAPTGEYGIDDWKRVIDINLNGVFYGLRYEIPAMLESGGGAIVNLASILGSVGFANSPGYVAAKHGVVGLTKQLAITYADKGITINAIGPGAVQTGLRANTVTILGADAPVMRGVGGDDAAVRAITPAGRRGTLDEIAAAAVYLASREASYVNGHTLMVDGGWIAR